MNISTVIFEKLKKMLKIADFANFGPEYLGSQIFPPDIWLLALNSKYNLVSHIFKLGIFNYAHKDH